MSLLDSLAQELFKMLQSGDVPLQERERRLREASEAIAKLQLFPTATLQRMVDKLPAQERITFILENAGVPRSRIAKLQGRNEEEVRKSLVSAQRELGRARIKLGQ